MHDTQKRGTETKTSRQLSQSHEPTYPAYVLQIKL